MLCVARARSFLCCWFEFHCITIPQSTYSPADGPSIYFQLLVIINKWQEHLCGDTCNFSRYFCTVLLRSWTSLHSHRHGVETISPQPHLPPYIQNWFETDHRANYERQHRELLEENTEYLHDLRIEKKQNTHGINHNENVNKLDFFTFRTFKRYYWESEKQTHLSQTSAIQMYT